MAMRSMVDSAVDILQDEKAPLRELGELLHESWRLKRELADTVSNRQIDEIYDAARDAGAIGGKLLGAGGGGFIVFYVEEGAQEKVRERLKKSRSTSRSASITTAARSCSISQMACEPFGFGMIVPVP